MRRSALAAFLLLLLAALPACKSADELYNEGQNLELQGRYVEAAHRYADALEKQPDLQKARGRLLEAGRLATDQLLARIDAAQTEADAADLFLDLDRLLDRAAALGVMLPVPETYAGARRATFDAAIDEVLAAAEAETARGRFDEALRRLERARRFRPSAAQATDLDATAADTYLAWAEADFAAGRFRSAYDHAGAALGLAGADVRELALALQAQALERGSLRVAPLPLWPTRAAAEALPDGLLADLNDLLEHEHWSRPPLFVRVAHPADVSRALRQLGLQRRPLRVAEAAEAGRLLDAHLVLTGEVERFARTVARTRHEAREARTVGGERVTYYRIQEDVSLRAVVALETVDPRRLDVVCERTVEHEARGEVVRGEYGGSLRVLDLSRSERRLFDADEIERQERQIEGDLLEGLAQRVADAALDCVTRALR